LLFVGEKIGMITRITNPGHPCVSFGTRWENPEEFWAWAKPVSQDMDEVSVVVIAWA
jgi:hypothetical protein